MPTKRFRSTLGLALFAAVVVLSLAPYASTQSQFKILHAFTGTGGDGGGLWGSVAFDKSGSLYGTTSGGGIYGYGTVFQLSPNVDGTWTDNILISFMNGDPNGQEPTSGTTVDSLGNVYGTTPLGGTLHAGTIFELSPSSSGWAFAVIYNFCSQSNCSDGSGPYAGLTVDRAGNLYGTAFNVFELSRRSGGWSETVLHTFCSKVNCGDGQNPYAGVILDSAGNIYGATQGGGVFGEGTVYEFRHASSGWKESLPHSFGSFPSDGINGGLGKLAIDSAGDLYGTTSSGGVNVCFNGCGTIYKLAPTSNGRWKETILYNFASGPTGFSPFAGVVVDKVGNLYGATLYGGSSICGCGTVFKLAPSSGGTWTYSVLHTFLGTDGGQPDANLVLHNGKLYGTAASGGPGGAGVVFEITP